MCDLPSIMLKNTWFPWFFSQHCASNITWAKAHDRTERLGEGVPGWATPPPWGYAIYLPRNCHFYMGKMRTIGRLPKLWTFCGHKLYKVAKGTSRPSMTGGPTCKTASQFKPVTFFASNPTQ